MKRLGFIIGPSGIGKDYGLGRVLRQYFGVDIFVSGDYCREHAAELAAHGALVPDDVITHAVKAHYLTAGKPDNFLFDCPRTVEQVQDLLGFYGEQGEHEVVLWHMHAKREVCEQRIKDRALRKQRTDDARQEVVDRRLEVYYAPGKGLLHKLIPFLADQCDHHLAVDANPDLELVRPVVLQEHGPKVYGEVISAEPLIAVP